MKRCPRCDKTYPASETFCEVDGTALVSAGPAFAESSGRPPLDVGESGGQIECPVCGGKAQPGELICNFCGARLGVESDPAGYPPSPPVAGSQTSTNQPGGRPGASPSGSPSMRITGRMPQDEFEAQSSGRGWVSILGYLLAAVVALGGGAWLALHLSRGGGEQPVAIASPAASASPSAAMPSGPSVALASTVPIQVTGESASAPERSEEVARKVFEDHKNSLLDSYSHALAGESTLQDAMIVRVRVLPGGAVDAASVRTSTNPNPGLDAEVVKDVSSWSFAPLTGGQVEVDYPVVFTNDSTSKASLESQLSSKLASLSPSEAPEYLSTPPSPASPSAESTPAALAPPVAAPASHKRPHREVARPAPTLTLQQRVKQALSSNSKLRRVDCYTSGGTVTIFGKVFDANAKQLAERVARGVPGVGNVIDSLSTDEGDWAARQARIAAQLSSAGLNNVTIKVIDHDAYLGGSVKTDAEKDRAVTIAESAEPVHVRTNLIMVEPGRVFGF